MRHFSRRGGGHSNGVVLSCHCRRPVVPLQTYSACTLHALCMYSRCTLHALYMHSTCPLRISRIGASRGLPKAGCQKRFVKRRLPLDAASFDNPLDDPFRRPLARGSKSRPPSASHGGSLPQLQRRTVGRRHNFRSGPGPHKVGPDMFGRFGQIRCEFGQISAILANHGTMSGQCSAESADVGANSTDARAELGQCWSEFGQCSAKSAGKPTRLGACMLAGSRSLWQERARFERGCGRRTLTVQPCKVWVGAKR